MRRIKRKKKKFIIKNILSLVVFIILFLAVFQVFKLNVLPTKYLILFVLIETILFVGAFLLYNARKKVLVIIGIILYILVITANLLGYHYISKINSYIDNVFNQETYKIETEYIVIASAKSSISTLDGITDADQVEYYKYSRSIDKALKQIGKKNLVSVDSVIKSMRQIKEDQNKYLLIARANFDYVFESSNIELINKDDFKIIHSFVVTDEIKTNKETPDTFNIYINGLDFTGIMRDYNLIATVNMKTRRVVLTSIPRDYYIDVPAYNIKDTLMCLGSLDPEVSKEALEKLLDIKIDYTINLNTNSLVDVVDSLGGIEYCSEYDFITTHAMVLNTFDDTKGKKLHVTKGCKKYNGIQILVIARERNAFPGRDRYRQKNCREILISIIDKLASTTTLSNYTEVLDSLEGLYTTDMNQKTLKKLIKKVIDGNKFEIIEQSLNGTDMIGVGHLGTEESWIMVPDEQTVIEAKNTIKKIQKGK
ncbi:MAG: LCP family protein [Bacilli bacterium]|nr:LCP family protein [Bacilli bacterium]